MSRSDALKAAEEAGLDLGVKFNRPDRSWQKIVDWGKYQYQKMKEAQKSRRNNKVSELLKQMRFGLKIGQGDLDIKLAINLYPVVQSPQLNLLPRSRDGPQRAWLRDDEADRYPPRG